MVIVAFTYAFICVLERVIYTTLSRTNISFKRIYYSKENGSKLSEAEYKALLSLRESSKSNYEEYYFQEENTNTPLICKYILSMGVLLISHLFIFFYLPFKGNYNQNFSIQCNSKSTGQVNIKCNDFSSNNYLIAFYLLHLVYFFFCSLQIRSGLHDFKHRSILMQGDDLFYYIVFKVYKHIPFLYEIKMMIDWTFTATSLDLFQWIKLESVHDLLFLTHCFQKTYSGKVYGLKIMKLEKSYSGLTSFILLLLFLLGPIWLFSSLNPTNQNNNIQASALTLSIQSLHEHSRRKFTLYSSSYTENLRSPNQTDFRNVGFTRASNFPIQQMQFLTMSHTAENTWNFSTPTINSLLGILAIDPQNENSKFSDLSYKELLLTLEYEFLRKVT